MKITVRWTRFSVRQWLLFLLLAVILWVGIGPVMGRSFGNRSLETPEIAPASRKGNLGWLEPLPPGTTVYYVKKGDTLYTLSRQYFVPLTELLAVNHIRNPERMPVHSKIYIPPVCYTVSNLQEYNLKPGDNPKRLCAIYHLESWQWRRLNPDSGQSSISQSNPEPGIGKSVFLPRSPLPVRSRSRNLFLNHGHFSINRPVFGRLTSRFGFRWGRMHSGIDLAAPVGTPVKAALAGIVVFAGWRGGYGLLVIMNHGRIRTYYGHLSVISVTRGQRVSQGSLVGLVGATGRAYGSHLHFEVETDGLKVNPLP